ncbi:MAG TPA: beta-ketoacyl synthase N-terminal-like domain-containing protein, partial [Candidatus Obscuribacterales bacterium]
MISSPRKVVLVAVSRTPIGKLGGKLRKLSATALGAHVLACAIRKARIINQSQIDSIVFGHAVQSFFEPNTARVAAQRAGLPDSIEAFTVQHQCASGMNAAHAIFSAIRQGSIALGLAVGVESMSLPPLIVAGSERYKGLNLWLTQRSPKAIRKLFKTYGPLPFFGLAESGLGPRDLARDPNTLNMMKTAQIVANLLNVSRDDADEFAARSQANAIAAQQSGRLALEIDPLVIPGVGLVEHDEHPRVTDRKTL